MTSEEMRDKSDHLIAYGTHWLPQELNETCHRCGELRSQHALGMICLALGFIGEWFCG